MTCRDTFPDGRFTCDLPVNHDGSHREGRVSWSSVGSQTDDRHTDGGHA